MRSGKLLASDHRRVLEQGLSVLNQLDDASYGAAPRPLSDFGVGPHVRHCLDYYQCFLRGVRDGRVDYDLRRRDERLERDLEYAVQRVRQVIEEFETVQDLDPDALLFVRMDATEADSEWCRSTVHRELRFLLSHTIHHYALMAWSLRLQGIDPGEEFGVAPSTLRHWRAAACAPSRGSST